MGIAETVTNHKISYLDTLDADLAVLQKRLDSPLSRDLTIGQLIQKRGISTDYIFELCGLHEIDKIIDYVNALSDTGGSSKDECDDNNSHAAH